jgi:pullulanase
VLVTDPLTFTPDWRLPETNDKQPASVILFRAGQLVPCDQDGKAIIPPADGNPGQFAPNNLTIIYELPTAWIRRPRGGAERGVGTFQDIAAMPDPNLTAPNFAELEAGQKGHAHIAELGINAIEFLPPADSYNVSEATVLRTCTHQTLSSGSRNITAGEPRMATFRASLSFVIV